MMRAGSMTWPSQDDSPRPYSISATHDFQHELRAIEAGTDSLREPLSRGIYLTLERDPHAGTYSPRHACWVLRQTIIPGLLVVQIAYTIDDERRRVEMVSIRSVSLHRL